LPAGLGTNTGTANHHTAPTLTGITVNNGTSTAVFIFDKLLAGASTAPTAFQLENVNGTLIPSLGGAANTSFSGNTVSAKFAPGSTATGVRGVVAPGAVLSLGDFQANPTVQAAARPGNSGNTNLPDLISTTLAADGSFIDFTYDESIGSIAIPNAFHIVFSFAAQASSVTGDVTIVNNNTVRWKPTPANSGFNLSDYNEYIVQGAADRGAVT